MSINSTIENRITDIELLHEMMQSESNQIIKWTWEYHINLNIAIINSLVLGKLEIANAMLYEIRRSTKMLQEYLTAPYNN